MKKLLQISLGVVTSVGGFLEMGSMSTSAQAGAGFGYRLGWALVLGTLCIAFLAEMAGRFAAVSGHTIADGMRDRFGFKLFLWPLTATLLVNLLVLVAEIGGVCIALELATSIGYRWWALPVAALAWLLLWKGTFGLIEKGVSLLGLVTCCFIVAALFARPDWHAVAAGLVPRQPPHDPANYWFIAVSMLGASITPSLFLFYSSGAIEDKWDRRMLGANRAISALGMGFGGTIALAVLIVAGAVLMPQGVQQVEDYNQLPLLLVPTLGVAGFVLLVLSLAIASFGATLEIALQQAYMLAQAFGWRWSEDAKPRDNAGFSLTYTVSLLLAALPIVCGADPLKVTIVSMALTAVSLPFSVFPFLVLMNDTSYVGKHANGIVANLSVILIVSLSFVLAVVTLPLEILGGS